MPGSNNNARKDKAGSDLSRRIDELSVPIVRAAILGSKEALGELCLLYKPIFWGYIDRYLSARNLSPSRGEDLLQDTFLSVVKSFPYYVPTSGNIGPLMHTIVKRVCASNANLKENRRKEIPMTDLAGSEDSDDSDWTVTDGMVAAEWMGANAPGHVEGPPPLQKPTYGGRPRLNKAPTKKVRGPRLPKEERDRREVVRQEWASGESHPAE